MAKRSLPKTIAHLKSIGGVQMEFLNKVGDNSKANGFPLVFGKLQTMIAQDYSVGIAFYLKCLGFNRSEADHIWRPFDIRKNEGTDFNKSFETSCSEPHLEMMDYLEKFMNAYVGTPKIAQLWPTILAHDYLMTLYHADEHFLKFFKKIRHS
ncbi:hypothetical protein KIN20_000176 [Parelaphostrongylus tenuis]|uniref:Uncharacterized protein n=1 Tax=Parelaphostrongylus tenuis TaxID=148309 RepID=A0AAD5LVQ8_PARTN|nr:hypothetical protein KIN20_000176 [Parelaphostrongylus tenuis]